MNAPGAYSSVRDRLRLRIANQDSILDPIRAVRYVLVQGPWQAWLVRRYQAQARRVASQPADLSAAVPLVTDLDVAGAVQRLEADAYARGFRVPGLLVDDILAFARKDGRRHIDTPHLKCEAVRQLAKDPTILAVARGYLEAEPILLETKMYWTYPRTSAVRRSADRVENFHYDLSDVKALKVYIYLTDVDEDSSPHAVIRGSHRRAIWRIPFRFISDDYALSRFAGRIEVITGPRGTGWFEDVTCYHKLCPGGLKDRLLLSFVYSLHRRPWPPW